MTDEKEYYQWVPWKPEPALSWVKEAVQSVETPDHKIGAVMRLGQELHVGTRFGVQILEPRDWLVRLPDGEIGKLTRREMEMVKALEGGPL